MFETVVAKVAKSDLCYGCKVRRSPVGDAAIKMMYGPDHRGPNCPLGPQENSWTFRAYGEEVVPVYPNVTCQDGKTEPTNVKILMNGLEAVMVETDGVLTYAKDVILPKPGELEVIPPSAEQGFTESRVCLTKQNQSNAA